MTISEILATSGGALFIILSLVQIAPIKINPWTALAKRTGKIINGELSDKVDKISEEVISIKDEMNEQKAIGARVRILRFGDECLHGTMHSKEHFDQILLDITQYNEYCFSHPLFKNNITELTSARIQEIYIKRLKDNSFL